MEGEGETRAAVYNGGGEINSSCRVRNRLDPDGAPQNLPSRQAILKYNANNSHSLAIDETILNFPAPPIAAGTPAHFL